MSRDNRIAAEIVPQMRMSRRPDAASRRRLLSSTMLCGALLVSPAMAPMTAFADGGNGGSVGISSGGGAGGADSATGTGDAGGSGFSVGNNAGGGGGAGVAGGAGGNGAATPGAGGAGGTTGGGSGGDGGVGGDLLEGGGGGGGGAHGDLLTTTATDSGATGGDGGRGGDGGPSGGFAGGGGGGGGAAGWGVVVDGSGLSYTMTGVVNGGAGGAGGDGTGNAGHGGGGGTGGTGVHFTGSGTLNNSGFIFGGAGGAGGSSVYLAGVAGAGGAGVVGSGLTITNTGTISGGLSGDGVTRANAISFTGGANSLTLHAGGTTGSLSGNIGVAGSLAINPGTLPGNSVTLASAITDNGSAGSVEKTGVGTLILTGTNSYTGGTTVSAGVLQIGEGTTTGSIVGNVVLSGGDLVMDRSDSYLFVGDISDDGDLTQQGSGTLILTGANTYTGGTTVSAGILQIGNGGATGSIDGDVDLSGGDLVVDRTGIYLFSGDISGDGDLTKQGAGTLILTGTNDHTGVTNVAEGTLRADGFSFSDGSAFQVNDGARLEVAATLFVMIGSLADGADGGGTVHLENESTLGVGFDGTTTTFSGDITGEIAGNGFLSVEGGALTLTGASALTGLEVCACSTLTLSGVPAAMTADGDVLSGGGVSVEGTMEVLGGASLNASSLLVFGSMTVSGADSGGTASQVEVDGPTLIGGLTTELEVSDGGVLLSNGLTVVEALVVDDTPAVRVTGEDSRWTVDNDLFVGGNSLGGDGILEVLDSGTVEVSGDLLIGALIDLGFGPATVSVSGAESVLDVEGAIISGYALRFGSNEEAVGNLTAAEGGTIIAASIDVGPLGLLNLGVGGTAGTFDVATIANAGVFAANHTDEASLDAALTGDGSFTKQGTGALTYSGDGSAFTGTTTISGGTLLVNDSLGGTLTVEADGTLGGSGTVGTTTVDDDAHFAPGNSIGTLTVQGDLTFSSTSQLDFELGDPGVSPSGGVSDRVDVSGDLTLDGTLNLSLASGSTGGLGYYRLMTYDGILTDNTLAFGTVPTLPEAALFEIEAGGGNVDLFVGAAGDDTLQHWIGGDGTWSAAATQWLNAGSVVPTTWAGNTAIFRDEGSFTGGVVTVDGAQSFKGLQFVDEGYQLTGTGTLEVDGSTSADGNAEIRVLADSATIATVITGTGGITKTEAGTLVLTGTNTYQGGTVLAGGAVEVSSEDNLGDTAGALTFNGGTLRVTGTSFNATVRDIVWGDNGGGFDIVDAGNSFEVSQDLDGPGGLTKDGLGTLVLSGDNSYSGVTDINAGTLRAAPTAFFGGFSYASQHRLASGATLDVVDFVQAEIGSLADGTGGGGQVVLGMGSTLLTGDDGTSTTFSGTFTGTTGFLAKTGEGVMTLTGTGSSLAGLIIIPSCGCESEGGIDLKGGSLDASIVSILAGTLSVTDGGVLRQIEPFASFEVGGGAVEVIGAGSTVSVAGDALIASERTRGFLVSAGGLFEVAGSAVFADSGAVTPALVTGAGSLLEVDGLLEIGSVAFDYTGHLTVANGGAIRANGSMLIDPDSALIIGTGALAGTVEAAAIENNGAVVANFSDTMTLASNVSGTGGLAKRGTGTLILSGANTYQGGTSLEGGVLQIASDGNLGAVSGGLTLAGGTLATTASFETARAVTVTAPSAIDVGTFTALGLTGTISGTGGLYKLGTGTLVLSGTNSYQGGTSIESGEVEVASDANLGAVSGALALSGGTLRTTGSFETARAVTLEENGTIIVASGTTLGLTGAIDGAGALVKDGFGTMVLSGVNSYAGGTVLDDGILQVAADANLGAASGGLSFAGGLLATTASFGSARDVAVPTVGGFDVASGTQLDLSGAITGAGTLAKLGAGTLVLSGMSSVDWNIQAGGLTADAAGFTGDVSISSGAGFTFDQPANAAYAGMISGSGAFTKAGLGALNLTGDSSGFAGATTVAEGLLSVNGSLGGTLDVLPGGTLGGNGTVGTTTIGGTVAPGNSIGTLNVAGDVTFNSGSTYEVEIGGSGASDLIAATGRAFLNGGTVEVMAIDPETSYQTGQSYTILTAAGGVFGAFDAAVSDSIFLDVSAQDLLNGVSLTIAVKGGPVPTPPVFERAAVTPNQFATAVALDTLPQAGPELALYNALLALTSEAEAQYAFDQLSGEANASAKGMFIEQSGLLRTAMIDRLRAAFGAVGGSAAPVMSYAAPRGPGASDAGMALKAVTAPATTEALAMWTSGFGSWGEMDGNINAASLSSSTGGFLIGADAALGAGWRLGVTGGYSYTDFDVDARNSSGDSENWHIGLYGGNQWGPLGLRTGLAYSWHDVDTARAVNFTGFGDSLSGSYDAGTFQAFGELGYRIDTTFAVAFEPFANLAYVSLHTDGFSETGGAAALTGDSSTTDTTFTTLGLRASTQMMLGSAATTLRGALGWRHAFGDVIPVASQNFFGSDTFTVSGTPIAEDAALVEAGLDVLIGNSTTLGVAYTGQFGDGVTQNGFNATLKISF